jgi:hypothetical protein
MSGLPDPLAERSRWVVAGPAAFTQVTPTEADRLAGSPGLRDQVQGLLLGFRASHPRLEGLMMYVQDGERVVGFAEVRLEADSFRWVGPHVER